MKQNFKMDPVHLRPVHVSFQISVLFYFEYIAKVEVLGCMVVLFVAL